MGARNVSAVFAMWADLAPLPKVLMVWMALKSLDQTSKEGKPPRLYYDGEESLIAAGGRGRRATYYALDALKDAGAIEVLVAGRMRNRAVYKLRLDPLEAVSQGATHCTLQGAKECTHQGAKHRTKRVQPTAPLGSTEGGTEESRGGDISSQALVSPTPVDNSGEPQIDLGTAQQIVGQALSIEAAATRIRELAADGADYTAAYIALAHQLQEGADS